MKDGEARSQIFRACCSLAGSFGATNDVDEENVRNFQLDLFFTFHSHDYFGASSATIFKVSKEPRIKRIARIRLRHEDQACRVRQLLAGARRVSIPIARS